MRPKDEDDALKVAAGVTVAVVVIAAFAWFAVTHECAEYRSVQKTTCTWTDDKTGRCLQWSTHQESECSRWVRRR